MIAVCVFLLAALDDYSVIAYRYAVVCYNCKVYYFSALRIAHKRVGHCKFVRNAAFHNDCVVYNIAGGCNALAAVVALVGDYRYVIAKQCA